MLCCSAGTALTRLSHQSTLAAIFVTGHKKMCVCGKSQPCSARNTAWLQWPEAPPTSVQTHTNTQCCTAKNVPANAARASCLFKKKKKNLLWDELLPFPPAAIIFFIVYCHFITCDNDAWWQERKQTPWQILCVRMLVLSFRNPDLC